MKLKIVFTLICFISVHVFFAQNVKDLRVQHKINPHGIDNQKPLLSWKIDNNQRQSNQIAYQILVASNERNLTEKQSDIWNSGKINYSQSIDIPYQGSVLKAGKSYFWKVKVWTNKGQSSWSKTASWSMGLLNKTDWSAQWIGLDKASEKDSLAFHSRLSARYLRKNFTTSQKIRRAVAYVSGIGMYEMYMNGKKIGDQVLSPSMVNFGKRTFYNTFDVTSHLQKGQNNIGVILGNGRFFGIRQGQEYQRKLNSFPKLLFQLDIEYADGSKQKIISDDSWKITTDGPILSNNEYDGEEYDARKELGDWLSVKYSDSNWKLAKLVTAPSEVVEAQPNENMKIQEILRPISITPLSEQQYILDMGQNMAGWLQIKVSGNRGDQIKLRFGESLNPDGTLYTANLRTAKQTDIYTLKGDKSEVWEPRFVYHGFRYVEISGLSAKPKISDFVGKVIYDGFAKQGNFASSNDLLNQIYKNAVWGYKSNFKGMPIDCPQRDERDPWLGDWATTSIGSNYIFNPQNLWVKWMDDIRLEANEKGQLPDIAPGNSSAGYTNNMTWPGTYLMIANNLYQQFGHTEAIKAHFPVMQKWLDYMRERYLKDYIMTRDRYGDWCVPPESKSIIHTEDPSKITDKELIGTAYYYYILNLMSEFATISGKENSAGQYRAEAKLVKNAFNKKFFNPETYQYTNNTVTANILPLAFNLVESDAENKVFQQIVSRIEGQDQYHLSTGLIGTQWLMRELTKRGRADLAYKIATQKTYPGWGYMIENGATTIWELWNGNTADPAMNSQNHVMLLGDLIAWVYEDVAGMKSQFSNHEFKMRFKPSLTKQLSFANASIETPFGSAKSDWKNVDGKFSWKIQVPPNINAEVFIPSNDMKNIMESGKSLTENKFITVLENQDGFLRLKVGSGHYYFTEN